MITFLIVVGVLILCLWVTIPVGIYMYEVTPEDKEGTEAYFRELQADLPKGRLPKSRPEGRRTLLRQLMEDE